MVGGVKEDFTVGVSFGATRNLHFKNMNNPKQYFKVPNRNGDVFAFNGPFNREFKHAILQEECDGPRVSIVIWGKQKKDKKSYMANNVRKDTRVELSNQSMLQRFESYRDEKLERSDQDSKDSNKETQSSSHNSTMIASK